jgi:hypothetical protein
MSLFLKAIRTWADKICSYKPRGDTAMARDKTTPTVTIKKRAPRKAAAAPAPAKAKPTTSKPAGFAGPGQRAALIAKAAYFRAESRGFAPGHETEDWLAAEAEVDAKLLGGAAELADLN